MTSRTDLRKARLKTAALLLAVALVGAVINPNFAFSGDRVALAWFVWGIFCRGLIFAGLASIAMVIVAPLLWKGTKWQAGVAVIFWMLGALILFLSVGGIRSLR